MKKVDEAQGMMNDGVVNVSTVQLFACWEDTAPFWVRRGSEDGFV